MGMVPPPVTWKGVRKGKLLMALVNVLEAEKAGCTWCVAYWRWTIGIGLTHAIR